MTVLRFQEIEKSYGEKRALCGVSFAVGAGEVFGLLGPNGAGKTTLIRILMDVIRPDSGSIELFGEPHRRGLLDRLGYLPEERGLYTKERVLFVLAYFGTLKGLRPSEARSRGREWLERMGLADAADHKIERLSKGMRQKVQIAATLLHDPELVVLDEPFAGLDPINARIVREVIRERRACGRTTILSTHQMDEVETLCDRVALLDRGRLLVYGSTEEVRRGRSVPEVRVRISRALPAGESQALLHVPGVEGVSPGSDGNGTWRLALADGAEPATVLAELVRAGAVVETFEPVLTSMEDVFVRAVEEAAG